MSKKKIKKLELSTKKHYIINIYHIFDEIKF